MDIYLEKIRPEANCFRFYEIRIEPDLFARRSVIVRWGRVGRPGRERIFCSGCSRDIMPAVRDILRLRLAHGYRRA